MKVRFLWWALITLFAFAFAFQPTSGVHAVGAVRANAGFNTNGLAGNDDESTGLVDIGFAVNFFGVTRTQLYVNNNGNVTFDTFLSTYTPFDLSSAARQIIAPFFADVDTRVGNITRFGTDVVDGRSAFGVNWIGVGYFSARTNNLNSFQLVLVDRSDIAPGDFDFEFNYDQIQWETGEASSGVDGLGGFPARAGYSNGTRAAGSFFELPGSATTLAFLDGGPYSLVANSLNSTVAGRYVFQVRGGQVLNVPAMVAPPRPCYATPTSLSVVGSLPFLTQAYYEPGNVSPGLFVNPGTYWIVGVDEAAEYYKIIIACEFVWVPVENMGPNYDSVWQGRALPTNVVTADRNDNNRK